METLFQDNNKLVAFLTQEWSFSNSGHTAQLTQQRKQKKTASTFSARQQAAKIHSPEYEQYASATLVYCSACANGFLHPNVDESVHLFAAPSSDSLCCCYDTDPQREVGPARMMHKGMRSVCSGPQCYITAQTQSNQSQVHYFVQCLLKSNQIKYPLLSM